MSRAFTREIDDAAEFRLPERPVSTARNLVTPRGAALIAAEIERLRVALESADPAEREGLLRDQRYWVRRQASMEVVPPAERPATVGFGVRVRMRRSGGVREMRIVGEDEADPKDNTVAWTSPIASALEGAEAGDVVEFAAGGRTEQIRVLEILS